jgi:hypothetical protein
MSKTFNFQAVFDMDAYGQPMEGVPQEAAQPIEYVAMANLHIAIQQ